MDNLFESWKEFRKGKRKKPDVQIFERNLEDNIFKLCKELENKTYHHSNYTSFYIIDPKVRHIHKAYVHDRIVHHAVYRVLYPIFDKTFIYDSCANRKGKGNLFALKRLKYFTKKVSENGDRLKNKFNDKNFIFGYCLKADIKHYFQEVDLKVLLNVVQRKITDKQVVWLIEQILRHNADSERERERERDGEESIY